MVTTSWSPASCWRRWVSSWRSRPSGDGKAVGVFAAVALLAGLALHLAGHVWFKARVLELFSVSRSVGAVVLLGAIPLVAQLRPSAAGRGSDHDPHRPDRP